MSLSVSRFGMAARDSTTNCLFTLIKVYTSAEAVGNLASPANYARFFLPEILPDVARVIWLDCDTLVVGDLAELWRIALPHNELLAACPRTQFTYGHFFSAAVQGLFFKHTGRRLNTSEPTYNAGVFVANLAEWRRHNVLDEFFFWMVGWMVD